jgi:hypothetical protein
VNRFLTHATAMALGLALCGIAKADGRTGHEGFERDRTADCDRDALRLPFYWDGDALRLPFYWDGLRYFDSWRLPLYWDGLHYFDHRWFDYYWDDLRHFDDYLWVNYYCVHDGHRSAMLAMLASVCDSRMEVPLLDSALAWVAGTAPATSRGRSAAGV